MDLGLDYAWSKPSVSAIQAGGYRFVLRYLSTPTQPPNGKVITSAELHALLAAGIEVGLNWEHTSGDALRGGPGGTADATEAVRQAKALGYPKGCTIYYSVDFDETASQADEVAAYIRAARAVTALAGYRVGAYGGFDTIRRLFDGHLIDDGWQTYAWSEGHWDTRAAMRQVKNGITVGGADCDLNERHGTTHLMGETTVSTPIEHQQSYKDLVKRMLDDLNLDISEAEAQARIEATLATIKAAVQGRPAVDPAVLDVLNTKLDQVLTAINALPAPATGVPLPPGDYPVAATLTVPAS